LLAGGYAVISHVHRRVTFDLALVICRDDRGKWIALAHKLGFTTISEGPAFIQFNPELKERQPLDLIVVDHETFGKLSVESVPGPPSEPGVKVVSLRHLLALKSHAIKYGHSGRVGKDLEDMIELIRVNRVDVAAPDMRELLLKHGTQELYERLRQVRI